MILVDDKCFLEILLKNISDLTINKSAAGLPAAEVLNVTALNYTLPDETALHCIILVVNIIAQRNRVAIIFQKKSTIPRYQLYYKQVEILA